MSSKKKQSRSRVSGTPQKGRGGAVHWTHCSQCDTWTLSTELEGGCCRVLPASGFIRAGCLHSSGWHQAEPERPAPAGWRRAVCYLAPAAAAALGLRAADRALVRSGARRAVCRVWPAPEWPPAAVGVPELTAARLAPLEEPPRLAPLPAAVLPAGQLRLLPDVPLPFAASASFREQLAAELRGLVFAVGHQYASSFMGTPVLLTVAEADTAGAGDELAARLARLAVSNGAAAPLNSPGPDQLLEVGEETEVAVGAAPAERAPLPPPPPRLGGLDDTLAYLRALIDQVFAEWRPTAAAAARLETPRGVLLYGPSGTGKSALAAVLAAEYGDRFHLIRGAQLASRYQGGAEENLRAQFAAALRRRPAVVFIDNVECVAGRPEGGGSERQRRLLACLLSLLDAAAGVALLAATARPAALDPAVRRAGRLDRELELPVPGPAARAAILAALLPGRAPAELAPVAAAAHGYVGADLQAVVGEARLMAAEAGAGDAPPAADFLVAALRRVKPSAMREVLVEVANVRWNHIGGQAELKRRLQQAVDWPIRHPDAFRRMGVVPPKGVLMYGPPGCSKTMIAKALATESGLNFISIKGPELFSKWVGESERAVREVFRRARQAAPAVVFFDELDALAVRRGDAGGAHSVAERVLAQLLTELDGVSALRDVTVLAATNRPDLIDPALLRPGRLDHVLHVPLPDEATRAEIARLRLAAMRATDAVSADWLASRTSGYSGAEVTAVCHEAALLALERDVEATAVTAEDFERALETVQPRVSDYDKVYQQFTKDHRRR